MNNNILHGGDVLYYALKMNGTVLPEHFNERILAEQTKAQMLLENTKSGIDNIPVNIEVVQVTADGKEVLFG